MLLGCENHFGKSTGLLYKLLCTKVMLNATVRFKGGAWGESKEVPFMCVNEILTIHISLRKCLVITNKCHK